MQTYARNGINILNYSSSFCNKIKDTEILNDYYLFSGKIIYLHIGESTDKLPIIIMSLAKFLVMSQNILSLINNHT